MIFILLFYIPNTHKRHKHKLKKSLKRQIRKYVCKQKDICCEKDIDREALIALIVKIYKNICVIRDEPDEWLNSINNDLFHFIEKDKATINGVNIWDEMDKRMMTNNMVDFEKVKNLLREVPAFYLLAFLGKAAHIEEILKSFKI